MMFFGISRLYYYLSKYHNLFSLKNLACIKSEQRQTNIPIDKQSPHGNLLGVLFSKRALLVSILKRLSK